MWLSRHNSSSSPRSTLMSCYFFDETMQTSFHIIRIYTEYTTSPDLFLPISLLWAYFPFFSLDFYVVFAMVRRAQEIVKNWMTNERRGKLIRIIIDNHKKCVWVQASGTHTQRMQNGKSGDSDSNLDCEWEKRDVDVGCPDLRFEHTNTQLVPVICWLLRPLMENKFSSSKFRSNAFTAART